MSIDTAAKCAPELHDGEKVLAAFYVREATILSGANGPEYHPVAFGKSYACCADHLNVAMAHCFVGGAEYVIVRRERAAEDGT